MESGCIRKGFRHCIAWGVNGEFRRSRNCRRLLILGYGLAGVLLAMFLAAERTTGKLPVERNPFLAHQTKHY